MSFNEHTTIRLGLPKGRMKDNVLDLLKDAGIDIRSNGRSYRPVLSLPGFEAKLLKPQNIVEMLHHGSRDIGFAGADWVKELGANLIELVDTRLDPIRLVAAIHNSLLSNGKLPISNHPIVVASEYQNLSMAWIQKKELNATFLKTYGATEVFPPDDADCIIDNTATGSTLSANNLEIVDEIMCSSTRLYANPNALTNPAKKRAIANFAILIESVLAARKRVMLEVNVPTDKLAEIITILPCMRQPTISRLHEKSGYAVKAAVPRDQLAEIIPQIKSRGGKDIVVMKLTQIVL